MRNNHLFSTLAASQLRLKMSLCLNQVSTKWTQTLYCYKNQIFIFRTFFKGKVEFHLSSQVDLKENVATGYFICVIENASNVQFVLSFFLLAVCAKGHKFFTISTEILNIYPEIEWFLTINTSRARQRKPLFLAKLLIYSRLQNALKKEN